MPASGIMLRRLSVIDGLSAKVAGKMPSRKRVIYVPAVMPTGNTSADRTPVWGHLRPFSPRGEREYHGSDT